MGPPPPSETRARVPRMGSFITALLLGSCLAVMEPSVRRLELLFICASRIQLARMDVLCTSRAGNQAGSRKVRYLEWPRPLYGIKLAATRSDNHCCQEKKWDGSLRVTDGCYTNADAVKEGTSSSEQRDLGLVKVTGH